MNAVSKRKTARMAQKRWRGLAQKRLARVARKVSLARPHRHGRKNVTRRLNELKRSTNNGPEGLRATPITRSSSLGAAVMLKSGKQDWKR